MDKQQDHVFVIYETVSLIGVIDVIKKIIELIAIYLQKT